jgi:protein-S-isoprenylcysteine O-methyltransferase Ste14
MPFDFTEEYPSETMEKSRTIFRMLRFLKTDLGIRAMVRYRSILLRILAGILLLFLLVSRSHWNGHMQGHLLMLGGMVLASVGAIGRIWCALFIAGYKNQSLVTVGPYSVSRNPLYFFSLLGAIGVGLASGSFLFPGVIFLGFMLYFPRVIKQEENDLRVRYKESFLRYIEKTPRFIPDRALFREPEEYRIYTRIFRKTATDSLWFIWAAGLINLFRFLQGFGLWPTLIEIY